jgi:hypothetical protein
MSPLCVTPFSFSDVPSNAHGILQRLHLDVEGNRKKEDSDQ